MCINKHPEVSGCLLMTKDVKVFIFYLFFFNDVKIENKELLRYFVFYLIFKFGANEIKYMNPDDIEKFYDDIFNLMTSKIAKIKCLC